MAAATRSACHRGCPRGSPFDQNASLADRGFQAASPLHTARRGGEMKAEPDRASNAQPWRSARRWIDRLSKASRRRRRPGRVRLAGTGIFTAPSRRSCRPVAPRKSGSSQIHRGVYCGKYGVSKHSFGNE